MCLSVIVIKLRQWSANLSPRHSYFSWGSLAVEDHLRSILGITCGRGSLAVLYRPFFPPVLKNHIPSWNLQHKHERNDSYFPWEWGGMSGWIPLLPVICENVLAQLLKIQNLCHFVVQDHRGSIFYVYSFHSAATAWLFLIETLQRQMNLLKTFITDNRYW